MTRNIENLTDSNEENIEPNIIKSEFIKAREKLKLCKASGVDDIPEEILKNIGKEIECIIFEIIKKMYQNDNISKAFAKSETILFTKKGNSTVCNNYRTISLLTHIIKILLIIIRNRIKRKFVKNHNDDQFGFKQDIGTKKVRLQIDNYSIEQVQQLKYLRNI